MESSSDDSDPPAPDTTAPTSSSFVQNRGLDTTGQTVSVTFSEAVTAATAELRDMLGVANVAWSRSVGFVANVIGGLLANTFLGKKAETRVVLLDSDKIAEIKQAHIATPNAVYFL